MKDIDSYIKERKKLLIALGIGLLIATLLGRGLTIVTLLIVVVIYVIYKKRGAGKSQKEKNSAVLDAESSSGSEEHME